MGGEFCRCPCILRILTDAESGAVVSHYDGAVEPNVVNAELLYLYMLIAPLATGHRSNPALAAGIFAVGRRSPNRKAPRWPCDLGPFGARLQCVSGSRRVLRNRDSSSGSMGPFMCADSYVGPARNTPMRHGPYIRGLPDFGRSGHRHYHYFRHLRKCVVESMGAIAKLQCGSGGRYPI